MLWANNILAWTPRLTNIVQRGFVVHGWAKTSSDMDLLFDGQSVIKTKAVRRIGEEWDATACFLGVGHHSQPGVLDIDRSSTSRQSFR